MELEPAAKLMLKRDLYIAREFSSEVRCELLYSCTKKLLSNCRGDMFSQMEGTGESSPTAARRKRNRRGYIDARIGLN